MSGKEKNTFSSILEVVRNTIIGYKSVFGEPVSLADVAKIARVEPITLISNNLIGVKELPDILSGILNIYATYYLQAVNILSAELVDIRILKILDKTNPDRDLKTLLASGYVGYESFDKESFKTLSLEGMKYRLPMSKKSIAVEGVADSIFDNDTYLPEESLGTSVKKLETFERLGSAVGKVLEVKFRVPSGNGFEETSITTVIKLDTMIIPSDVIRTIITSNDEEITLGNRFKQAIYGRINFIKDFILASDLIKAHKRMMIKDPTGYYADMLKRINKSRIYSVLSGSPSLAGISSIIVISNEDEAEIQKKIGGKLTNKLTREIFFENTNAMLGVVVDKEWERVTVYVRDIDGFSQDSFANFKELGRNANNEQLMDMLKAFTMGNPITI